MFAERKDGKVSHDYTLKSVTHFYNALFVYMSF